MTASPSFRIAGLRLSASASGSGDLELRAGQLNVLLGRNFSGKTALARLIAGLPTEARGDVQLHGRRLDDYPIRRRPVAMVYQAFVNYPHWRVFDNIASPIRASKRPVDDLAAEVSRLATMVGLADLLDRKPHELSGGQQQRLAIARALAKDPDVLVMDEPLVNLDYKLREALEAELRTLLAETGITVVYTTSDPRDALGLGDHVVLLAANEVLQSGEPLAVYREPVSLVAADLMSDPGVNRLDARRAVRPEHVSLQAVPGEAFEATVIATETNGTETYIHARVEDREWVVKTPGLMRDLTGTVPLYVRPADIIEVRST